MAKKCLIGRYRKEFLQNSPNELLGSKANLSTENCRWCSPGNRSSKAYSLRRRVGVLMILFDHPNLPSRQGCDPKVLFWCSNIVCQSPGGRLLNHSMKKWAPDGS
ncbi:hypothetical protein AVEN_85208-1 [Araneus ventricosus]|uniref:Uncharacterized protein n=1 Tax=Araneus ventricosus TaxID=182803 RepID=A0A4Y2ECF8_ARAVE|nr:hypothetical protein AVEN_85208-1 [Araneus ventricosus]